MDHAFWQIMKIPIGEPLGADEDEDDLEEKEVEKPGEVLEDELDGDDDILLQVPQANGDRQQSTDVDEELPPYLQYYF
ncbi:hypothetical protein BDN71DRAFT_1511025 [Pleurotus eryngii]|uniref:Uncharacterized protein n=1 Tax=Pleurotus eryngii TaxID=5323 RepID=A0A9P5ZND4_PLEER|nr:hypothetical protein BDN71DRAFT_1511025 [Pleurotus eryngii]